MNDVKRILCIRPDNIGDLLMSTPAIRALKETFQCHITLLTSSAAALLTSFIPEIDDTIVFNAPWVSTPTPAAGAVLEALVQRLRNGRFDAAVVFTVYSQNPLPSVMLAYLAGIPLRLAYCRENPYGLLTHWAPEKEPYSYIRHQVRRDLDLVAVIGAHTSDERLSLQTDMALWPTITQQIAAAGADPSKPWLLLHAGVSERKREYPPHQWAALGRKLLEQLPYQLLLTGSDREKELIGDIQQSIGPGAFSLAGRLDLASFITLIHRSPLLISVNTSAAHIAAATGTPVVVLYAMTNPQHTPWKATSQVLYFDVPISLQSKNEVVQYAYRLFDKEQLPAATIENVMLAVRHLLGETAAAQAPA